MFSFVWLALLVVDWQRRCDVGIPVDEDELISNDGRCSLTHSIAVSVGSLNLKSCPCSTQSSSIVYSRTASTNAEVFWCYDVTAEMSTTACHDRDGR